MSPKTRSVLEDAFIVLIVIGIIYAAYHFLFNTKSETIKAPIQEVKTEQTIKKETSKIIEKENIIEAQKIILKDNKKEEIKTEEVPKKEEPVKEQVQKKITLESFYAQIEKQIYSKIQKNVEQKDLENRKSTKIRITILKNGMYEQLRFMNGDKKYYELIRSSVVEVFPLNIDDSLKKNFPRYFRMEVKN